MALNPRGSNNVGTITQRFIKVSSLRSRALAWYVTEWYPQVNDEKWFLIFRVDRERTVPGIKSVSPRSSSGTPKRTLSIHRAFSRLHAFSSLCTACLRKWDRWVSPPPPFITTIIARFSPSILLLTLRLNASSVLSVASTRNYLWTELEHINPEYFLRACPQKYSYYKIFSENSLCSFVSYEVTLYSR